MNKFIITVSIVLGAVPLVHGELQRGSQTLTLEGGGGFSASDYGTDFADNADAHKKIATPGGAIGAQYIYFMHADPGIGVGLDLLHSALQEQTAETLSNDYLVHTRFDPTTVLVVGKVQFGHGAVQPYLLGGVGIHSTHFQFDLQPKGPTTWSDGRQDNRPIVDGTGTGFAGAAGLGFDIFLTPTLFIGGEGRFTYLGTASYPLTAQANQLGFVGPDPRGDIGLWNVMARVGIKFGAS